MMQIFLQNGKGNVKVKVKITGFDTMDSDDEHGFYVNEFGDIDEACENTGM